MIEIVEPVVIISDVHLSAMRDWRGQLEGLRGLWRRAGTVIFNGDTLNISLSGSQPTCDEAVRTIKGLCESDGVRPIMLSGNSDFRIDGPRHVFLSDGRVIVLHGDVVFPGLSPWRRDIEHLARTNDEVMREMGPSCRDTLEGLLSVAREAFRRTMNDTTDRWVTPNLFKRILWWLCWSMRPRRIWAVLDAWRRMPALAADFCRRHAAGAEVIIFGHAHRRGLWRVDGRTIINTGSFEGPGLPSMVTVSEGRVIVQLVDRRGDSCLPGRTLAEITLDPKQGSIA